MLPRTFTPPDTALGRARPKLDLRLTTLAELGLEAFAEQPDQLERARSGFRRTGPLSFLRGAPSQGGLESSSPLTTQVFLTVTEKGAFERLASDFLDRGLVIQSTAETVGTAHLPLSLLKELEARADVVAIEWSGAFRPATAPEDDSPARGLAPREVMGLAGAPSHVDGTGTLVGVVDCAGLDLYHPSFVDEHGRSRVRALWDQRAAKLPPAPASALPQPRYGRAHDRASLDEELSDRRPKRYSVVAHHASKSSHGTTTASIAAGLPGDRAAACGVAPGAELVFVDTFGSGAGALGALTELADAISFVFDVADAAGKPCAVNVSLGDDLGPRDGTSPVERFIDQKASAPGRAVIVAAGNSGERRRHAAVDLTGAPSATFEIEVGRRNLRSAVIEIWYSAEAGSGAALDVEIEAPEGGGRTPRILPDGRPLAFDSGTTRVLVASTDNVPVGESGLVRIELLPGGPSPLTAGTWKVHVFARGGVREARASIDHPYARFTEATAARPASTVTSPATSRAAITVGAFDLERRQTCWYSGRAPGKPELLAPGGPMIAASASTTPRYLDMASGTSVAAPLVTGAVALLFQQFGPDLAPDALIAMLTPPGHDRNEAGAPVATLAHVKWPEARADAGIPEDIGARASQAPPRGERQARSSGERGAPGTISDLAQIWAGSYVLHQGGQHVGRLLVTPGEAELETVEHWLLGPAFVAPSAGRRVTRLQIRYSGSPEPEKAFLARFGRGKTYIRARCTTRVTDGYAPDADVDGPVSRDGYQQQERDTPVAERDYVNHNFAKPADAVQIWAGEYILRQAAEIVGKLYVEELTGPADTKEHWLLYGNYRWPSSTYPNQELSFHYQNIPGRLSDFLASPPEGSIYVIARCELATLP